VSWEAPQINELRAGAGDVEASTRPSAVSFVTTEHFALQSARAATIAESTGRATMFLASASGGLIALGLVATATGVGTGFYAFGLVLLPTLAFVGLVTFERVLQTGLEDYLLHRRIELLREYYFREAPELRGHLASVPQAVFTQGSLLAGRRQVFRSVAGMVGVITAVLAGATAGLIATVTSGHSLAASLISGIVVALAVMVALMRFQESAFLRTGATPLLADIDSDQAL
jgi:fatty acid desaturase